jgi:predicted transcriptional regulator
MTAQDRLEKALEDLDLTNIDLARLAGVAPSSVQRWTAGTVDPPVMLFRLLDCMLVLQEQRQAYDDMRQRWEHRDETVQSA